KHLGEQLGLVVPAGRIHSLELMFRTSENTRGCPLLLPLLLWAAGPYELWENFVVRAPAEKVVASTTRTLQRLTQRGPPQACDVRRELWHQGLREDVQKCWVLRLGRYRFLDEHVVRWRNVGDKAVAVLAVRKHPMTLEDISAEIEEEHNLRTLANRLVS